MTVEHIAVLKSVKELNNGIVEISYVDCAINNGEVTKQSVRRKVLPPGDDISNEHDDVVAVCNALWTPEVIAAYKAACEQS